MDGLFKVNEFMDEVVQLYHKGLNPGVKIGWINLDELYRVVLGQMTVITGLPQSGKSEVLDAIMVKLAITYGYKFAVFSPENWPITTHFIKIAEKFIGKPFKAKGDIDGMTHEEIERSIKWVTKHFIFMYPDEKNVNLSDLLLLAQEAVDIYKIQGFVLDPWNEIEHKRPSALSETEYISQALGWIRRFSRKNYVHTWIVAHPTKLRRNDNGSYDCPDPYSISGSAHWRNKPDMCITVHRPNPLLDCVEIHVQKVRFKWCGRLGMGKLVYDPITGLLTDDCMPPKVTYYGKPKELPKTSYMAEPDDNETCLL